MPTLYNPGKKKGIFYIPSGGTKSPTPTPSFSNTKSILFDGVDDYVDINPAVNLGTTGTYSFWMKKTVSTSNGCPIGYNWTYGYVMLIINERAFIRHGTSISYYNGPTSGANTLRTTDWVHIALVRDTTTSFILYINGTNVYTDSITASQGSVSTQIDRLGRESDNGNPLGGNIDEVAAWNIPLDASDITSIYNGGTPADLTSLNPIAWYRMGENSTFSSQILMPENTNKDKFSNYSMVFDGINDYVDTGITTTGANDVSISCWIKTTQTFAYTLTKCAFGGTNLTFGSSYSIGRLGTDVFNPNSMRVRVFNTQGTTKLNDGNWHNIIYTWDYSTGELKAYVDGNTTAEATVTVFASRSYVIAIGNNTAATGTLQFEGNVDECAYFTRVLGASDITEIWNLGVPKDISGISDLESWWRMGEEATFGATWNIPDQIGSNDGTSANMTIEDRVGDAPSSANNALSYNMDAADIVEDVPPNP